MKKLNLIAGGFFVGIVNALFGAGGGMIAVPLLTKNGLSQKEAQATAVSVILPLTVITSVIYYFQGNLNIIVDDQRHMVFMAKIANLNSFFYKAVMIHLFFTKLNDRNAAF